MQVESSRNDTQGTVGDRRERELSDVAGTLRRSDTVQQGVSAAVSFTITRASTTGVQRWQEGQGELGGATGREAEANGSDGVLGTEAGKFHDGASNLARRNAAANCSDARGEGKFSTSTAMSSGDGGTNAAANCSDARREG